MLTTPCYWVGNTADGDLSPYRGASVRRTVGRNRQPVPHPFIVPFTNPKSAAFALLVSMIVAASS